MALMKVKLVMKNFRIFLVVTCITMNPVWSWGPKGHMIVGQVAQKYLSKKSIALISKLSPKENLADLSNWSDLMRSDPAWDLATTWHYVSIPSGMTYEKSELEPKGDVITAIKAQTEILQDKTKTISERRNALAFLVHFIGDIHQPLHVGEKEDHGGNSIRLTWFGARTNLHSIWDEQLIEMEKMSYTEFADALLRYYADKKDDPNFKDTQIMTWVDECQNKIRPLVYQYKDFIQPAEPTPTETTPTTNKPVKENDEIKMKYGWEYSYKLLTRETLHAQLYKAGRRLAEYLNSLSK